MNKTNRLEITTSKLRDSLLQDQTLREDFSLVEADFMEKKTAHEKKLGEVSKDRDEALGFYVKRIRSARELTIHVVRKLNVGRPYDEKATPASLNWALQVRGAIEIVTLGAEEIVFRLNLGDLGFSDCFTIPTHFVHLSQRELSSHVRKEFWKELAAVRERALVKRIEVIQSDRAEVQKELKEAEEALQALRAKEARLEELEANQR